MSLDIDDCAVMGGKRSMGELAALRARIAQLEAALRMAAERTTETALANELRFILRGSLETVSDPCRIYEHDGAFRCYAHHKTWGSVSNPDQPCAGFEQETK